MREQRACLGGVDNDARAAGDGAGAARHLALRRRVQHGEQLHLVCRAGGWGVAGSRGGLNRRLTAGRTSAARSDCGSGSGEQQPACSPPGLITDCAAHLSAFWEVVEGSTAMHTLRGCRGQVGRQTAEAQVAVGQAARRRGGDTQRPYSARRAPLASGPLRRAPRVVRSKRRRRGRKRRRPHDTLLTHPHHFCLQPKRGTGWL